ncbi:MAG: hypothetical protein LBR95_00930 [Azoarcus sp.]|nr:hypothetical protein [Azoarcus sp.]
MVRLFGALHQPKPSRSAKASSARRARRRDLTCAWRWIISLRNRLMGDGGNKESIDHRDTETQRKSMKKNLWFCFFSVSLCLCG